MSVSTIVPEHLLRQALTTLETKRRDIQNIIAKVEAALADERKPLARARRRMTRAERQAVSQRMRKYWAQRRRKAS